MMLNNRKITIALIGDHPDFPNWKEDLVSSFSRLCEEYPDESLEAIFTRTLNPSKVPFVPVSSLGAQTVDLILCREQLLGARADITVMIDSGVDNKTLETHTEQLCKAAKAVILWGPLENRSLVPNKKDEIGGLPGSMYLNSNLSILTRCLYFLCIGDTVFDMHEEMT